MDPEEENNLEAEPNESTENLDSTSEANALEQVVAEDPDSPLSGISSSDGTSLGAENTVEEVANTGLLSDIWASAYNIIELGGPVVTILIVISVFGFAIALFKFFQFSSLSAGRFNKMHLAVDSWQKGDLNDAKQTLENIGWPIADTVLFGLERQNTGNDEQLREELTRQANNFINPYAKYLRPLELIYYLAPVLGLLGTVLGMIEAFKGLEASSGLDKDSTALAGGIWEALLTTAVGLSIAIPFTMIHAWLESRLDNVTEMTSDLLTRVLTSNVNTGSGDE